MASRISRYGFLFNRLKTSFILLNRFGLEDQGEALVLPNGKSVVYDTTYKKYIHTTSALDYSFWEYN